MQNGWNPFRKKCITRMPYKITSKLTEVLQKGDIMLYRAKGSQVLGSLIAEFTRSPYSHADIYVGDGWSIGALGQGMSLDNHFHTDFVDILRCPTMTETQRDVIVGKAFQQLAKPYEYLLLFSFPFLTKKAAAKRAANQAFMCSEVTAWCYKQAGIDLLSKTLESTEAPADIGMAKKLEFVTSFYKGEPCPDAKRNVRHAYSKKSNWFSRLLIKWIADPNSTRDEYYQQLHDSQELIAAHAPKPAVASKKLKK
jgi:hypothetical protein